MNAIQRETFIDPTPVSSFELSSRDMQDEVGGAIFVIIIIACGGRLGAATVITVGTVVVTVVD